MTETKKPDVDRIAAAGKLAREADEHYRQCKNAAKLAGEAVMPAQRRAQETRLEFDKIVEQEFMQEQTK